MNGQHLIIVLVIETKTTTEYERTEFFTGGVGEVLGANPQYVYIFCFILKTILQNLS